MIIRIEKRQCTGTKTDFYKIKDIGGYLVALTREVFPINPSNNCPRFDIIETIIHCYFYLYILCAK